MAATPTFAHVVLQTNRLEEMRDWYCTVLDAHVVFEGHGLCFSSPSTRSTIASPSSTRRSNSNRSRRPRRACTTPPTPSTRSTTCSSREQLERKGITPKVPIQHGVTTSLYYQDPDGNFVELQIDNFSTPDDATAYMRDQCSANPVGVSFDPALMRQARRHGTPMAELITRSWALWVSPELPDPMPALTGA